MTSSLRCAKTNALSKTPKDPAKSSTSAVSSTLNHRLSTLSHQPLRMSLDDDRNWASKIYQERADVIDADRNVTYFFLKDYREICRYMRTIGYG